MTLRRASWTARPAAAPTRRWQALARFLLVLAIAIPVLAACTGTETTRTPVVLFVGGNEGGEATIRAFATNLPFDPGAGLESLAETPGLRRTLGPETELIDLATVSEGNPQLYVLYRETVATGTTVDRVARFDLNDLDPSDPTSLSVTPDATFADALIEVGSIDILAGEPLCLQGLATAPDGAWIGVLHEPSICTGGGSPLPVVLAFEAIPDGQGTPAVGPSPAGSSDANAVPVFLGQGDDAVLAWLRETGEVVTWSPRAPGTEPTTFNAWSLDGPDRALGRSGTGLAVTDGRNVVFASGDGTTIEAESEWRLDGIGSTIGLVDADVLAGVATIVLGDEGLVAYRDLTDDPSGEGVSETIDATEPVAVLGPYGYLYVAADGELRAYDAFSFMTGSVGSVLPRTGERRPLGSFVPRAADWSFAFTPLP